MRLKLLLIQTDLYTFDVDDESARASYEKVTAAYERIFALLDLPALKGEASS